MSETPAPLFSPRAAVAVIAALLAVFGVVTADLASQARQRSEAEKYGESTAVGDQAFWPVPPTPPSPPVAAVQFQGDALVPVSYRRIPLRETRMKGVGREDGGAYTVYLTEESAPPQTGETERAGAPVYFLKTALGEFIKVQPASKRTE